VAEGFTCEVEGWSIVPFPVGKEQPYRSICAGLDFYGEHDSKRYCVLHFPGAEKKDDFKPVLESRLDQKNYDFRGTIFPDGTSNFQWYAFDATADFSGATFLGASNFSGAHFSGQRTAFQEAKFSGEWTYFQNAKFSGERTDFSRTQFRAGWANFVGAQFRAGWTDFGEAEFSGDGGADFQEAKFHSETTDFREAKFSGKWTYFERAEFIGKAMSFSEAKFSCEETSFKGAKFRERAWFWGTKNNPVFSPQAGVSFEQCRIEKPELLTFNTVLLHPSSFINTDVRNVDFTDVKWYGMPGGPEGTLEEEIDALTKRDIESPHILLSQTCQRLSANAEENREYPLANEFYYWSMDALRKKGRRSFGPIRTLYWALSGYGVRARRAFLVLLAMWAAFTILYGLVDPPGFEKFGQGISYVWQSAVYSLLALARLNPEPRPELPGLFQFLVGLEGLLGPLQIGLLLLAIRRQVMR
jgi:uncharacterized protein YjbI with pentapeptide repeats